MTKLSIIVITKNEEENILDCLKSASFADEVIVLDSGSTDNTIILAESAGAKVFSSDWVSYGDQKNKAIDLASNDWIFSLDADERIPEMLQSEIKTSIQQEKYYVFDVPRSSLFISRFMKHSGWRPDRTKRLFKKQKARFTNHKVHEHLDTTESVGRLKTPIVHYSYRNIQTVMIKLDQYSTSKAEQLYSKGVKGSLSKALLHSTWAFLRTYFLRLGFLDGKMGLILALYNAQTNYYSYIKLMLLGIKNKTL